MCTVQALLAIRGRRTTYPSFEAMLSTLLRLRLVCIPKELQEAQETVKEAKERVQETKEAREAAEENNGSKNAQRLAQETLEAVKKAQETLQEANETEKKAENAKELIKWSVMEEWLDCLHPKLYERMCEVFAKEVEAGASLFSLQVKEQE